MEGSQETDLIPSQLWEVVTLRIVGLLELAGWGVQLSHYRTQTYACPYPCSSLMAPHPTLKSPPIPQILLSPLVPYAGISGLQQKELPLPKPTARAVYSGCKSYGSEENKHPINNKWNGK